MGRGDPGAPAPFRIPNREASKLRNLLSSSLRGPHPSAVVNLNADNDFA